MYIAIDTAENDEIVFHFFSEGKWQSFSHPYTSEDALLVGLSEVLNKAGSSLQQLTGLAVRVGVGRFTATRVAVTMANTLGYSLGIPVIAHEQASPEGLETVLAQTPVGQYAHASYSAPASVGGK